VYEKGRKEGNGASPWTRLEIRFLRRTCDVVVGVLDPENWLAYLRGAGQYFASLFGVGFGLKMTQKSRSADIEDVLCTVIKSVEHVRDTYGRFLYWLGQMVGEENALRLLAVESGQWVKIRRFPRLASDEAETMMSLLLGNAVKQ
jgi:DNA relaxase NicK